MHAISFPRTISPKSFTLHQIRPNETCVEDWVVDSRVPRLPCHPPPPPPLRGVSPTSPYFLELWSAFSHWLMAAIVPLFPGLLSSQPCRHSSFPVLIALMYSCTHSSLWKFRTFRCQQNETTFCRIFWNSIQMKNIFKNRMKLGNGHIKCRFSTLTVSFLSKLAFFIVV